MWWLGVWCVWLGAGCGVGVCVYGAGWCAWVGVADGLEWVRMGWGGWEVCGCVVRVRRVVGGLGGGVVCCDRDGGWWVCGCGWVEVRRGAGGWRDVRVGGMLLSDDAITN